MTNEQENIKLLFMAAEAAPLVKIGGLGDYIGSLPAALLETTKKNNNADISLDIRIAIPYSKMMDASYFKNASVFPLQSRHGKTVYSYNVYSLMIDAIQYYVLDNKNMEDKQDIVYSVDPAEDGEKFIAFSLACLDLMEKLNWKADIIQANDWQTGVICAAVKKNEWQDVKSIFTIHNLPYMGAGTEPFIKKYGISRAKGLAIPSWGKQLPLVIGLDQADRIITVSPRYAEEILTPRFGNDLQDYLITQKQKISGILNGIDEKLWNPETDPLIQSKFSLENFEQRNKNKTHIQESLDLPAEADTPLFVMVSRLDRQKGIRLLCDTLRDFSHEKWQAVILGTGSIDQEELVHALERAYPDSVRFLNRYDTSFSHQLPAGGDMFLMPSLYEPCGISQMIAMHYGCIPVASAVGGLVDSIDVIEEDRTGFLFHKTEKQSFLAVLEQAVTCYHQTNKWRKIQIRAMQKDFSWKKSAQEYLKVYQKLTRK